MGLNSNQHFAGVRLALLGTFIPRRTPLLMVVASHWVTLVRQKKPVHIQSAAEANAGAESQIFSITRMKSKRSSSSATRISCEIQKHSRQNRSASGHSIRLLLSQDGRAACKPRHLRRQSHPARFLRTVVSEIPRSVSRKRDNRSPGMCCGLRAEHQ